MKILFTGDVPAWTSKQLEDLGHQVISVPAAAYVDEAKFCAGIKGVDVYVCGGIETCGAKVIETADVLKVIIFLGVEFKAYIDADAAARKNIPILNTPGANARAVAELAFFLALAAARKAVRMLADMQQKSWKDQTGFELQGKTLGLIGSGPIAQNVAMIGSGFGMKVIYWSRSGAKADMKADYKNFEEVLAQSDVLSLHVPLEAGTILDSAALGKMQPHAILVNTGRAHLVDAEALQDALLNGKLGAAAFDVFYAEGEKAWQCPEAKLLSLPADKFFLMPHAGWRTAEADNNMFRRAIDYIKSLH